MKKKDKPQSSIGKWLHGHETEHDQKKNTKETKPKKGKTKATK